MKTWYQKANSQKELMPLLKAKQNKTKTEKQRTEITKNEWSGQLCRSLWKGPNVHHEDLWILYYEQFSQKTRKKKENPNKTYTELSEYMGVESEQICWSPFPAQLKLQVTPMAHHFWRLKNCVELMKERIRKKTLELEETQRNFGRDTSDLVDNTKLSGKEELETGLNPWW